MDGRKIKNFIFGIALSDYDVEEIYLDKIQKEYHLSDEELKELKPAHLFKLSDFFQYTQFDADIVYWNEDKETFYSTGDFEPTEIKKEDVVALSDENSNCEII